MAIALSAVGLQSVAAHADVLAALCIRSARYAVLVVATILVATVVAIAIPVAITVAVPVPIPISVLVAVPVVISAIAVSCGTPERSIVVGDFAATGIVPERCTAPLAARGLAIGLQGVSPRTDVLAGLRVGTTRPISILIAAVVVIVVAVVVVAAVVAICGVAPERSIVVYDFAGAVLVVRKLRGLPVAIGILTGRGETISIHANIPAGLLIRARRISLRGVRRCRIPESHS